MVQFPAWRIGSSDLTRKIRLKRISDINALAYLSIELVMIKRFFNIDTSTWKILLTENIVSDQRSSLFAWSKRDKDIFLLNKHLGPML
jgi:hypothetical protein